MGVDYCSSLTHIVPKLCKFLRGALNKMSSGGILSIIWGVAILNFSGYNIPSS